MKFRLPKEMRDTLDETGFPWTIETGKRHHIVRLNGRHVCILPFNGVYDSDRTMKNGLANIRRAARMMREGQEFVALNPNKG